MKHLYLRWPALKVAVLLILVMFSLLPFAQTTPNAQAAGAITGVVFQDFNANGIKDIGSYGYNGELASAIDQGVGGIVVNAYDASGLVGTTVTAADGSYTLNHTGNGTVRVEFSGLPSGFQPGPQAGAVTPTGNPAGVIQAGTTVQFVTANGTANLGIIRPEEYCQNNPQLATPCYVSGDPLAGGTAGTSDVLVSAPYTAINNTPPPTHLATGAQIGSVWGEAWQRDTQKLFTSAFVKRHSGLGSLDTGGIYVTDLSSGSPVVSPYIDVKTLGIDTGSFAAPRGLPALKTDPSADAEAFGKVGKLGLGGITLSDDGTKMWLVNLNDRTLYSINIGNPAKAPAALSAADVTSYSAAPWLTASPCTNGVARPFGVKYYRGKLYTGVVCTAELGGTAADLSAFVYALDPTTSTFTSILNFPLNYQRGVVSDRVNASNAWYPWLDTYSLAAFKPGGGVDCCNSTFVARPMPILSDLEFDASGALVLGFIDRAGHQFGFNQPAPDNTGNLHGTSGGDILRACNVAGSYVLEANGSCGGQNGTGIGDNQGPGGGEFYAGETFAAHQETAQGGLAYLPGSQHTVTTAMDPINYDSGGFYWMNNVTGYAVRRYEVYFSGSSNGAGTFGKAAGIGDTALLCNAAPIEIGNRIWKDLNGDGVQDPNEPGIAGATVQLYAPDGTTLLGTAITDSNGDYLFSSAPGTNGTNAKYGISGLTPNTSGYSIRLDNAADYAAGGVLAGLPLSPANASQDQRDSDATLVGGFPRIDVTTGVPGANNHTYDVGFVPYSLGNRVWFDTNNNGSIDGGESGIANVGVSLFADSNADGLPDSTVPLATTLTDASGYYRFDNLIAGTYVVQVDPVNFQTNGPLNGRFSSTTTEANPNSDSDSNDNGIDTSNQVANGVQSGPVTLGPGSSEPTNEADLSASGQGTSNNQANMTVDFGFYEKLSLGNYVWYDTNNNGQVDSGEQPIPGVTLRLYADTNNNNVLDAGDTVVGSDQTTDSTGHYLFTGLDAGNYFVQTLPGNFTGSGALVGYSNSSGAFPGDTNNDHDHGTPVAGQGVVSEAVTLSYGGEPTTDGDTNSNTNLTIDFGFYKLTVGNQVWRDDNNNGQIDSGEPALPNVRVELYNSANNLVAVTSTDSNGNYLFTQQTDGNGTGTGAGIVAGDYYVKIPPSQFGTGSSLPGYHSSTGNDTGDVTDNNDNGIETGSPTTNGVSSPTFTLTPGSEPVVNAANGSTSNTTIDFGFYTMSLGNLVWNDANNNGVLDAGEQPLPSVAVNLYYDADGDGAITGPELATPYASTTTNASGHYLFTGLAAGNYVVELASSNFGGGGLYAGYFSSTGAIDYIGPFDPAPDPDSNTADSHDNGSADTSNAPTFLVRSGVVTLSAGNEPTSATETGGNSLTDPAIDVNSNLTVDFGLFQSISLGNRVWVDTNNNGAQDASEVSVPDGVVVNLYLDADGNGIIDGSETTPIASTTVGGLGIPGEYLFPVLSPGTYMVELAPSNFASGGLLEGYTSSTGTNGSATGPAEAAIDPDLSDSDTDDNGTVFGALGSGGGIRSALVTLTFRAEPLGETTAFPFPPEDDNATNLTVDFGVFKPATVGNFVWYDTNHDGVQDAGETGVPNITVVLHDVATESVVATTTTDSNGFYQFTNLAPGTYDVTFTNLPTGTVFTAKNQGNDDTIDSDVDPLSGEADDFTLTPGANDQTHDAGIYNDVRASLGNFVWYDTNENGIQDAGEAGVPGVVVKLYQLNASGTYDNIAELTTGSDGSYLFSGLLEGDYYVDFIPPTGYVFSGKGLGGDATLDSDADTTTGQTTSTHLDPGETDLTWDAGIYYSKVALGNRVWRDTNNDGMDNSVGGGLPGVTVNLYVDSNGDGTPDGGIVKTTTTDTNGYYLFDNLDPDTYIVEVIPPAGYISSSGKNGATSGPYEAAPDPDNDINLDDNGTTIGTAVRSGPVTLTRGGEPVGEITAHPNPDTNTPDANSNLTVDFGLFQPLSLGDKVWHDANDNGIIDGTESGISGVTVNLYDANNALVLSTTTDSNGNYLFTNLGRGDYTVEVVIPTGFVSSTDINSSATPNGNTDNDDNGVIVSGGTVRSGTITLLPNSEPADDPAYPTGNANRNPTVDFGFYQPLSLGNLVWYDLNNNGIVDNGETGIPGVAVNLYRQLNYDLQIDPGEYVGTTITDANGNFRFDNLRPGDYVLIPQMANFASGAPLQHYASSTGNGSEPPANPNQAETDTTDNNDNGSTFQPNTVLTHMIPLISGQAPTNEDGDPNTNLTVDFGFYPLASIGDFVWLDSNHNGVQDANEPGEPGVSVGLYQLGPDNLPNTNDDIPVGSTVTGPNGQYQFTDLVPGDYFVRFTPPLGYAFTMLNSPNATSDTNSDADTSNGSTAVTTLTNGENDLSWDAGLIYTASLGDRVWLDQDANGIQNSGEPGIPGVTVTLYTSTGTPVSSTVTDGNGNYNFPSLQPGDYYVEFTPSSNYLITPQDRGSDNTADSDADPTTHRTPTITVALGTADPSWDAGMYQLVSLGNTVWHDVNDNGVQDVGESGLSGATVTLYTSAGAQVGSPVTTDATGAYMFSSLVPGDYYVEVTPPAGYVSSTNINSSLDPNNNIDNDDNGILLVGSAVRSGVIQLRNREEPADDPNQQVGNADANPTVDFGFYMPLLLGNTVWKDSNNNTVIDNGETGIDGVTVNLYRDENGNNQIEPSELIGTQVTSNGGLYQFTNLRPGDYLVELPSSNFATGGPLEHFASSNNGGVEPVVDPDNDTDNDDNGVTNLSNGTIVSPPITLTSQGEPTNDGDADVNSNLTVDFGLYPLASLGDYVWLDINKDGIQDASEPGFVNLRVDLYRPGPDGQPNTADDIPVQFTTTGPNGQYLFKDLPVGDYFVSFDLPISYTFSLQDSSSATDTTDSDVDATGFTGIVNLSPGENDLSVDAGLIYTASLGDRVWLDQNANGVQDAGEPGIPGVTVTLYTSAGVQSGPAVTTDANGDYSFGVLPGDYYVVVTPPAGYTITQPNQGGNSAADSNGDPTTGQSATVTVPLDGHDPTIDFGLYQLVSLGNQVWNDVNNNGLIDATESGINGVLVNLYRDANGNGQIDAGEAVASQTTSGGGYYLFDSLLPGSYLVQLDPTNFTAGGPLAGYSSSTGSVGTQQNQSGPYEPAPSPDNDSNNDDNGSAVSGQGIVSLPITLTSGGEPVNDGDTDPNSNLTVDFGVFQPASLGSIVWSDTNSNGMRDSGEPGIAGVTVTLYDASGNVVATTTTGSDGSYQFTNLSPGAYSVGFSGLPSNTTFTQQNQGGNDANDSDVNPSTGLTQPIVLTPGMNDPSTYAGVVPVTPTAISLVRFTATRENGAVVLRWVTAREQDTFGFHLYRSTDGSRNTAVRVTPSLIVSKGNKGSGASYSWTDTTAQAGVTYSYWLQETELDGTLNEYGPIQVQEGSTQSVTTIYLPVVRR